MAIFYPDILQHNNPTKALVDITELRGTSYPIGVLEETGSIPTDKRKIGQIIFVSGSSMYYSYYGQTVESSDWNNPSNWKPNATFSGSYTGSFSGSYVGDLLGTSSYSISSSQAQNSINAVNAIQSLFSISASHAVNALTSSYSISSSQAINSEYSISSSIALNANTASYILPLTQDVTINGNLVVTNSITTQTLNVQTVTSSIVYSSGSNIFGSQLSDVQAFTGSLRVTGSGNHWVMGGNIGINNMAPSYSLDVTGEGRFTGRKLYTQVIDIFDGAINLGWNDSPDASYIKTASGDNRSLGIGASAASGSSGYIHFVTDSTVRLVLNKSGNVVIGEGNLTSVTDSRFRIKSIGSTSSTYSIYVNNSSDIKTFSVDDVGNLYALGSISGSSISAAGSNGQIQFNSSGQLAATSSLFWDNANNRLGIGNNSPITLLSVGNNTANIYSSINTLAGTIYIGSSNSTRFGFAAGAATLNFTSTTIPYAIGTFGPSDLILGTNNTEGVRLKYVSGTGGYLGIGTPTPLAKLHVSGNILATSITGSIYTDFIQVDSLYNTSSYNAITINNSSTESIFRIATDGTTNLGNQTTFNSKINLNAYDTNLGSNGWTTLWFYGNAAGDLSFNKITGSIPTNNTEILASRRWIMSRRDTETGSNVGSNFYWQSRTDTGQPLRTNLYINRSSGFWGINGETSPSAVFTIRGNGSTSSTYAFWVKNSSNVRTFAVDDAGNAYITGSLFASSITGSFSGSLAVPGSDKQILYNNAGALGASSDLVIAAGGRLGLRVPSPGYTFDMSGSAYIRPGIEGTNAAPTLILGVQSKSGNSLFALSDIGSGYASIMSQNGIVFQAQDFNDTPILIRHSGSSTPGDANGNLLSIQNFGGTTTYSVFNVSGSLGLGTDIPTEKLHVVGNARFVNGNVNIGNHTSNLAKLHISGANNTYLLWVSSPTKPETLVVSGSYIGVGLSTPLYQLHVSGAVGGGSGIIYSDNRIIAGGGTAPDPGIATKSTIAGLFEPAYANLGFASYAGEAGRIETNNRYWNIGMTGGTAKFNIRGIGSSNSTTALLIQNSTPTTIFSVKDGGTTWIGGPTARLLVGNGEPLQTYKFVVIGDGVFASGTATGNGGAFSIDQYGTSGASRTIWYNGSGTVNNLFEGAGNNYVNAIAGNFGIGTSNPADNVYISGSASWVGLGLKTSDPSGRGNIYAENDLGRGAFVQVYGSTYSRTLAGLTASNAASFMGGSSPSFTLFGASSISGKIHFGYGSAVKPTITINTSYFVGINTVAPSASLHVSGNMMINDSLYSNVNTSSLGSGTVNLVSLQTGSYTSAFYNYIITSGSNSRAGQLMSVWNGSELRYTDTSTTDIGDTSLISFTASLSSNNVIISSTFPTAGWSVKTLINLL